ncbi:hypothetical protein H5410_036156, partial [Solanum commersonii]
WSHLNFTYTKSSNIAAIFCHIRSDPDVVAKSLLKFVNYWKRKKESVAELLVTLLVKLRSYGSKDYVQVPMKPLGHLKRGNPKFVASDFTDRSQNATRIVRKAEVKHMFKCIRRTSEYSSAFMDGLVEKPTLKF